MTAPEYGPRPPAGRIPPATQPVTRVFGWASPWGGDDNDRIPRSYWVWYRLFRWTRQALHAVGRHQWRTIGSGPFVPGSEYVHEHRRCDWCGQAS